MTVSEFLPTSAAEMARRGWQQVDIILVSGDAYVDHPSFGVALIGRLLESKGFKVAMLCQPRHDRPDDFRTFGRPRLFFGISAGNLDSIVSNYSGNGKVRDQDNYSPDGNPYFPGPREKHNRRRPDRATIRYANLARQAYDEATIVLGGIEASLRRFGHYDYQQQKLRGSVLTDAKADLLLYGMAERAVVEVAERLARGEGLTAIAGSCQRLSPKEMAARVDLAEAEILPSLTAIKDDPALFLVAEQAIDRAARANSAKVLVQEQQGQLVVQYPAADQLSGQELDSLYELPYTRRAHPAFGRVPAWEMIRHSLTIVRGCSGNCSFCAITRHQGSEIVSRSKGSIKGEIAELVKLDSFKGTISDLGGPTANLYGTSCAKGGCPRRDCLFPRPCPHLRQDEEGLLALLRECKGMAGVTKLFVSSGLRMELLLQTPRLLRQLIRHHVPGAMKIAPEHCQPQVLHLMHKEGSQVLVDFLARCRQIGREEGKAIRFTPYFISAHPGCRPADMAELAGTARRLGLDLTHVQDFTPSPGTLATAMYVSGRGPDGRPIFVARGFKQRMAQRAVLQGKGKRPPSRRRKGGKGGRGGKS
ncbi:MAG: YgiQ family radical SAM protein [Thermodesulfobacteriota bacterium]